MTGDQFAWVTRAPADYVLLFTKDPDGEHSVVNAAFPSEDRSQLAGRLLEGAECGNRRVRAYCTLPEEPEQVSSLLRVGDPCDIWSEAGTVELLAVAASPAPPTEETHEDSKVSVVTSLGGDGPRCYRFTEQCPTCGEFRGKINVLPQTGVLLDTRTLSCRCVSIPCRYCEGGRIRRPLTEHFDPERRAGRTPWFGYLVPCGDCQAHGRGPRVVMSSGEPQGA